MSDQILARIVTLTEPVPPPPIWSFLPSTEAVRHWPSTATELHDTLRREFAVDELVAARVLLQGPDGATRLSPVLNDNSGPFLCLLRAPELPPFDIVTRRGSLVTDLPPALCYAEDADIQKGIRASNALLVTMRDSDLVVLRQLQLPAVQISELLQYIFQSRHQFFNIRQLTKSQHTMGITMPRSTGPIVIVSWSVAALTEDHHPDLKNWLTLIAKSKSRTASIRVAGLGFGIRPTER